MALLETFKAKFSLSILEAWQINNDLSFFSSVESDPHQVQGIVSTLASVLQLQGQLSLWEAVATVHKEILKTKELLLITCSEQLCPAIQYCLDKLGSTMAASSACLQRGCWKACFHSSIIPSPTELYFLT